MKIVFPRYMLQQIPGPKFHKSSPAINWAQRLLLSMQGSGTGSELCYFCLSEASCPLPFVAFMLDIKHLYISHRSMRAIGIVGFRTAVWFNSSYHVSASSNQLDNDNSCYYYWLLIFFAQNSPTTVQLQPFCPGLSTKSYCRFFDSAPNMEVLAVNSYWRHAACSSGEEEL